MKKIVTIFCAMLSFQTVLPQKFFETNLSEDSDTSVDTIRVSGQHYRLVHYHMVSRELRKKMLFSFEDEIFNDSVNNFSKLIFHGPNGSFDVATIPLTHLVFLEDKKVVIGLSKIVASPYHIVIYSLKGELLSKSSLESFDIKLTEKELKTLAKQYDELIPCLERQTVIKEDDNFYVGLPRCLLNFVGRDSIMKTGWVFPNRYFPNMSTSTFEGQYRYQQYYNSFADSDPLYDLIMIGLTPYILILNSKDGRKVNIPLLSNCDIQREVGGDQVDNRGHR